MTYTESIKIIASHPSYPDALAASPELRAYIESQNVTQVSRKKRYVELLSVANRNGLKHGKSWVADGFTVDKNSLSPEAEGRRVCYIYS